VADAALVLSVIAGPDDRDRHSRPQADFDWLEATSGGVEGLRVAFTLDWGYAAVDPEVRRIVEQAVMVFENDLGCRVQQDNPGWGDPWETFWTLVAMESDLVGMRRMADELGSRMSPHLFEFLHKAWSAEDFTNAVTRRKEICNQMWKFMRRYDLLLTPTVAVPPFPLNVQGPERIDGQMVESSAWIPFTFPINMTGQPAASVPAGWTGNNLPVGLQIIGRHLADETVLRASAAFEAAAPWGDRWPPIISQIAS
jgi:aspartyl-tRNA(Asn)/glutamyl-tRNA(Gln) amidotransferase subunit A